MTLCDARPGQSLRVTAIRDDSARMQALRLGLTEGSLVTCQERILGGPVIIRIGLQELAVGGRLAGMIDVSANKRLSWEGKAVASS